MKRILSLPFFLIVLALSYFLSSVPSGYYLLRPGGAYEIAPILELPPEQRQEIGRLAFTAVRAGRASWWQVADARVRGDAEVVPSDQIVPSGMTTEELNQRNQRLIEESKLVASVVGLRAAGLDARVTGQGAEVGGTLEGMPAEGLLQRGDVIVAVDGQPTDTAPAVVEAVRRHGVGDQVRFTVYRDGQELEVVVGTRSSPTEPGRPLVGVAVSTYELDATLPFPVSIDTGNVGGPSAGLMFSIAIFDAVTPGDLARGNFVAGTGTIAVDGTVGPIGGAAEKIVAAEQAGATVFLVPREDEPEARRGAHSIRVVPIVRFADAVQVLCSLEPQGNVPAAPLPLCTNPPA
jgi:PDZ domain-containing protein